MKDAARPRGMRAGKGLCALLGVALATAGPLGLVANAGSPAATDTEASRGARRKFQSAEVHFHAGRFAEALADYQAGYDAAPLPGFLVNIAQCQRRLGDLKKARATYQKFLLVAPDSPLGPDVRTLIAEIDQALLEPNDAKIPNETANETTEDQRSGVTKSSAAIAAIAPPPAAPEAQAPAPALLAAPAPASDQSTAPTEHAASRTRWWLWGTLAAVAGAGVVGAFALLPPDAVILHDGSLGTLRR